MNAKETLELISKQWCDLNDLRKLTGLGKNSASKLKTEIRGDLINKGYYIPSKLLPMNEVVSYLKNEKCHLIATQSNIRHSQTLISKQKWSAMRSFRGKS